MRPYWDDYGIACVSAMRIGKQMQFFGTRAIWQKHFFTPLTAEKANKRHAGDIADPIKSEYLDIMVMYRFDNVMDWLAMVYVNALTSFIICIINMLMRLWRWPFMIRRSAHHGMRNSRFISGN